MAFNYDDEEIKMLREQYARLKRLIEERPDKSIDDGKYLSNWVEWADRLSGIIEEIEI